MVMHKVFGLERDLDIPADVFPTPEEIAAMEAPLGPVEHGTMTSCIEGAKLHTRAYLPKGKPKAVIIYMHGIEAHSGEGDQLSDGRKTVLALMRQVFNEAGIALHAFDHYGHGYSEGPRFFVPKYESNLEDYMSFIKLVDETYQKQLPVFLMGASYGGCLTIHASRRIQDDPSVGPQKFGGAILFCPAIFADVPGEPVYSILRYVLAPAFPKWTPFFMPNPVSAERIWKDPEVLKMRTVPRLREMKVIGTGEPYRLGTALAIVIAMEELVKKYIPGFNVPFFLAHGTEDYGVKIEGSEFMWRTVDTPAEEREFHRVEGGYHDLFSLKESAEYLKMVVTWIEKRMKQNT